MNRSWIGAGLLAGLLVMALGVSWAMGAVHKGVIQDLQAAETAALAGDWEGAKTLSQSAEDGWTRWDRLRKCFADHTPVEEIDAQFAMLESIRQGGEAEDLPSLAAQTAQMVKAIGEAHQLTWESFF